jgi:uncharacterized protein (UPF0303 family)
MAPEDQNQCLLAQREATRLQRFDSDIAWQLGAALKRLAERDGLALAFEVRWNQQTVFSFAMSGCTPANADWIRRKRNTTELLHESSSAVGRGCLGFRPDVLELMGLDRRDHAAFGCAVPLRLAASGAQGGDGHAGVAGVVTASGAPDFVDHNIVIEALASVCGTTAPLLTA